MSDIAQFFNSIKDDYTESVRRSNPCYAEMLEALLGYLPAAWMPNAILELGCGTGNLTLLLRERFPETRLIGIDVSEGSLEVCQRRLGAKRIDLRQMDMRTAKFEDGSLDMVVSGLALHHLTDAERRALYPSVCSWLRGGGWFVFCDRFRDESAQVTQVNRKIWQDGAFSRGTTAEEWQKWMTHEAGQDHPGTLIQQVIWLKDESGFAVTDIVWRKYLWAVVYAQKRQI
jgi:tRNA (cmo5U34)-methyltransferase